LCVSLTPSGRRVFQKLWKKSDSLREELLADMPGADVSALVTLLERLTASLNSSSLSPRESA
jgi:DNA-binding MarR family transcriptional regulator